MSRSIRNLLSVVGLILVAPLAAQTQADAEAFVKKAMAFAKANGTYKLVKEVNTPGGQFKQGELYIWIVDLDGVIVAHGANPKLIGKDLSEKKDSDSVKYAQEAVKVAQEKGSGWIEYKFMNPVSNKVQAKVCYVEKCDDLTVACGIYKP